MAAGKEPTTQLDVSVTLCAVFLIVAAVSVCAYYDNGVDGNNALAFLLAWVSSARSARPSTTRPPSVLIDLDRFRLYDALEIRPPESPCRTKSDEWRSRDVGRRPPYDCRRIEV